MRIFVLCVLSGLTVCGHALAGGDAYSRGYSQGYNSDESPPMLSSGPYDQGQKAGWEDRALDDIEQIQREERVQRDYGSETDDRQ